VDITNNGAKIMELWSWVLAAIGVTGIFFVGKKTVWGWLILLANECIWIAYAVNTKQYGFIISALAYAAVYIRSYIHWKREDNNVYG
jgi:nicotinamide riboside transporter PnuC